MLLNSIVHLKGILNTTLVQSQSPWDSNKKTKKNVTSFKKFFKKDATFFVFVDIKNQKDENEAVDFLQKAFANGMIEKERLL